MTGDKKPLMAIGFNFDSPDEFRKPNWELWIRDRVEHGSDVAYRDGHYCTQCGQAIEEDDIAPINVVIRDPNPVEMIGPRGIEREFCSWECFADWAAVQAGREPSPRDDS